MMNHLLHAPRRASCASFVGTTATNYFTAVLRRRRLPTQNIITTHPISTTPSLAALSSGVKTSPEEPRTAQKKVKKEKKGPSASKLKAKEMEGNRIENLLTKAVDAPVLKPPPASKEEMERRYNVGRNYVIGCFRRHNELNHDLAVKIRMKKHAVKMLPRKGDLGDVTLESNGVGEEESVYGRWRDEAMKINDDWGPPDHRPIPMFTPPIEGFDPNLYMDQEEEEL